MTEKEIIQGLIQKDERITREFFFMKCRPLFCAIRHRMFDYEVDYEND